MEEEVWVPLTQFNGKYETTESKRVRNSITKEELHTDSYGTYRLRVDGKVVKYNPFRKVRDNNDLEGEVWKPCVGYEEYLVSNFGRVKSPYDVGRGGNLILLPSYNRGYPMVKLHRKSVSVHRLVATTFIPNPNNYPHVNHKDEDKANNHVDNLEWCTRLYNVRYGTAIARKKAKLAKYKKPINQYDLNGNFIKQWESAVDAAKETGSIPHCICENAKGKHFTHNGYIWKYANDDAPVINYKDEDLAEIFIVYKHISPDGKIYVGQTKNKLWSRCQQNGKGYMASPQFYEAIKKYGWENFRHEIVAENLTCREADKLEMDLISFYHSNDPKYGYNTSKGAQYHNPEKFLKKQKESN